MPNSRLMPLQDTATFLNIDESSIRRGRLGTHVLTRVRPGGGKRIFFIREEVEQLVESWIQAALDQKNRGAEFLKARREKRWLK